VEPKHDKFASMASVTILALEPSGDEHASNRPLSSSATLDRIETAARSIWPAGQGLQSDRAIARDSDSGPRIVAYPDIPSRCFKQGSGLGPWREHL